MRTAARRLTAILLLAASGCASTATLEEEWIEVESSNFSVFTTLDEPDARQMLEEFELFRAALLMVMKLPDTRPYVPTEIYAFRSAGEFRPRDHWADGFFIPGLRLNMGALAPGNEQARWIVYHEYTHFLLRNGDLTLNPLWFEEGLAELFSLLEVDQGVVRIGTFPRSRLEFLRDVHRRQDPEVRLFPSISFGRCPTRRSSAPTISTIGRPKRPRCSTRSPRCSYIT